jgi:hypothetical protein
LECLEFREHHQPQHWEDHRDNAPWLELLRPFTSVKDLVLSGQFVRVVGSVLEELSGDRVAEGLPTLQTIFVQSFWPSRLLPLQTEIGRFITTRHTSGHPVTINYPVQTVGDA